MIFVLSLVVFLKLSMGSFSLGSKDLEELKLLKEFKLTEFRTIDGYGNNLKRPKLGATFTDKIRIAPQDLPGDQVAELGLPSPREISNWLHRQPSTLKPNPFLLSSWNWAFGQFIDHDIAYEGEEEGLVEYCLNRSCPLPIRVPPNDYPFSQFGVKELEFFRSPYNIGRNSFASTRFLPEDRRTFPERKYPNVITHWVDASTVYGSTKAQAEELRDLSSSGHGRLKTDSTGMFPPLVKDATLGKLQFLVGDTRGNENLVLASIHTLFVREHNRIADLIWVARGFAGHGWCDRRCNDDIFEHARAYLIGLMQKITYEEWLPQFMGPKLFEEFVGTRRGYNPHVDPTMTQEFTVAAFRVGHTMVNNQLFRANERLQQAQKPLPLADAFFRDSTSLVNTPNEMTQLLLGLGAQKAEAVDSFVVDALRNMLFGRGAAGMDLTSLNAQRNRDNGNSRFQQVRRYLCLYTLKITDPAKCPPFNNFSDFHASPFVQKALAALYGKPEAVELFVAGLLEQLDPGAHMGRTFGAIIGEQFRRTRDGDRFWYEDYLPPALVKRIKNDSLAKVLARNLNVQLPATYNNVFRVIH